MRWVIFVLLPRICSLFWGRAYLYSDAGREWEKMVWVEMDAEEEGTSVYSLPAKLDGCRFGGTCARSVPINGERPRETLQGVYCALMRP